MAAAAAADDGTSEAAVSVASSSTARVVEIDASDHSGHPQQRSKRKLYRSNAKLGAGESFQVKQTKQLSSGPEFTGTCTYWASQPSQVV